MSSVVNYIQKIASICRERKPLVAINCITYNQAQYIREALEGFIIQRTDYHFVAIIHDDASTDGTQQVIEQYANKYPEIILPIYETENQYSKGGFSRVFKIMNSANEIAEVKYIAICEGDDYWTDPYKLQKQIEFLESHPDYGMCYTKVKSFCQETNSFKDCWGGPYDNLSLLLIRNTIPTLSVVLRQSILNQYYTENKLDYYNWKMADYPIWLYFAANSKIKFFDKVCGVYRILVDSASHKTNVLDNIYFRLNFTEISAMFAKRYGKAEEIKLANNNVLWNKFLVYCFKNNSAKARRTALSVFLNKHLYVKRNLLLLIGIISPMIVKNIYLNKVRHT